MTHNSKPSISALMPAYNAEKYISETIESILNQTFGDFELIVVNDGSTDNTEHIVKQYNDPRIRYVVNGENLGIAKSYNRAIELAQGKYLAVTEADDVNHSQRFAIMSDFLNNNSEYGVISANVKAFSSKPPEFRNIPRHQCKISVDAIRMRSDALFGLFDMPHPSQMMRASVLAENQIRYDVNYKIACDRMMLLQFMDVTKMAKFLPQLVAYRRHGENMSGGVREWEGKREMYKAVSWYLGKHFGLPNGTKNLLPIPQKPIHKEFADIVQCAELILEATAGNTKYDRELLEQRAGEYVYRCFRRMYGDITPRDMFMLYKETPFLRHIKRKKKIGVYAKCIAYQLNLIGR